MDELERFVIDGNVSRLIDRLGGEREPGERTVLARIMLEEEDKFARDVYRVETAQRWIDKCDRNITRFQEVLEKSADGAAIQETIRITQEIRSTLVSFKTGWEIDMNHAAKFAEK